MTRDKLIRVFESQDRFATKYYPEQKGGLMVCGINYGGEHQVRSEKEILDLNKKKSFFSDCRVNNYRYRNRLLRWFSLCGFSLAEDNPTTMEKSIMQTNWLPGASKNIQGWDLDKHYTHYKDSFLLLLEVIKPRIIFFTSVGLLEAFNTPNNLIEVRKIFGKKKYYEIISSTPHKIKRKFRFGFEEFERCKIIAVPHPTGARVPNEPIIEFSPRIKDILNDYSKIKNGIKK